MFGTWRLGIVAVGVLSGALFAPVAASAQAGPGNCGVGLVPRNAYPGDAVCVTLQVHDQAITDNLLAPSRTNPDGSCIQGFVWRQAIPSDHVCVLPETQAQTQADNERSKSTIPPAPAPVVTPTPSKVIKDPFTGVTGRRTLLIIAPDEFMPALEPLVAHKNSTGMPTIAVSIDQLTSHFAGIDDPEKVKRGIQYAAEHLSTQYVMLVGDAHWFPVRFIFFKNFSRAYPHHADNPKLLPVDGVYAPSDLYYANLYHHNVSRSRGIKVSPGPFDDWNAEGKGHYNEADWGLRPRTNWNEPNPDRVDGYPDVAVARATAHSVKDVTTYVNKIIRYETERPANPPFTFVADGFYEGAPRAVDPIIAKSRLSAPAAFLQINKVDGTASARWTLNATPADVASKINSSVWVGYLGHGSQHGWDGRGFQQDFVKLTANNDALPVVFADGCVTGRFAIEAPFDYDYIDTNSVRHQFIPAPNADPDNPSAPVFIDKVSGQSWGTHCAGCNPLPLVTPPPSPYDLDRGNFNFAYPWLFSYPQGGAIAYFGNIGVEEPWMGAEFETYMLTDYVKGQRVLGAIYLQAERQYWEHHIDDPGVADHHSPSRLYLGFLVMFGDPSLRMH